MNAEIIDRLGAGSRPSDPIAEIEVRLAGMAGNAAPTCADLLNALRDHLTVEETAMDRLAKLEAAALKGKDKARHSYLWSLRMSRMLLVEGLKRRIAELEA